MRKVYILKHFDKELLAFSFVLTALEGTRIEIVQVFDEHKAFLPLGLSVDNGAFLSWIKSRTIPKNREFVYKILMELGLSFDNIEGIVGISKSLSLNDCYWIVERGFEGSFEAYNLYDNDFNKTLGLLAYTGHASVKHKDFISSPEFTTNGMLAKAWRKNPQGNKGIFLYKSGSWGFANSGKEPYSEFYASQIAQKMGLNVTPYTLGKWKGKVNSICGLFSSKEYAFMPVYHLVKSGGWEAVLEYYKSLGEKYYEDLVDMLIFDVLIVNTDRHFGNFGFLLETQSNRIVGTAPIFDNGLSLFYDGLDEDLMQIEKYAQTKMMKNAGSFMLFAQKILSNRVKKKIAKLRGFRFERHSKYNLPAKRLKQIEGFIQQRAKVLLAEKKA